MRIILVKNGDSLQKEYTIKSKDAILKRVFGGVSIAIAILLLFLGICAISHFNFVIQSFELNWIYNYFQNNLGDKAQQYFTLFTIILGLGFLSMGLKVWLS